MSDSQKTSIQKTTKKIKRPKQYFDLVEIWWDDASALRHGWEVTEELQSHIVLSVGFLVRDTAEDVIIAQDLDDWEHNGRSRIPRGMVRKIKVLKKKDKDGTEQIQNPVCSEHIQE